MAKLPLQSSNNANIPSKTIEQTYQKVTQLEHILLRPDTYIGSIEKHTQNLWVFENDEMVNRTITYVPGLYKIFDEILVNAADNKQRCSSMDSLKVDIDVEQNCISVYNNGDGVPVEIHQELQVYVPEMIFGHLLTSSNYNDEERKTTGGRNGYGAKLTNIFSTEFVIQTADGKRLRKYKQVFSQNMGKKSEPTITKCKESENWTKVSFKPDLAKFKMDRLEDDVVALMKKRVVDMAGCLGKTVKVELNGQRVNVESNGKQVPVKTFLDYANLYLHSASKNRDPLPMITEKVNDRWEICVTVSDGHFQQVSFVNSIATTKGGTHVDYVTNQITKHVINIVKKKNKNAFSTTKQVTATVKNHLWVFVNALIDNPAFDSQTKENLTTKTDSFGSKCELSPAFLTKLGKLGIVENLLRWAEFKQSKDLKKTDGGQTRERINVPKLEDANEAGKAGAAKCTLILTEGDSAKALAMAGMSVVGRDYYGVFPLRGKLLNVREASTKQIMDNAEIQNIKKILGLKHEVEYDSTTLCTDKKTRLRYGHLMIMTDQDHDGSHIKGLLINFIHSFWPSLLKVPSFLVEFITPIVKATRPLPGNKKKKEVKAFYSMPDYEEWKETLGGRTTGWSIKYYKGLGTSTAEEGKQYFKDLALHKKDFVWEDDQDADAIDLAFSKKKIEARKNWLRQFEPGTQLDQKEKRIKYRDFVNKELILFSMADLQRSIPSMVDGLKPGQRKILFCSFKRKNFQEQEMKVAQFSGFVSEKSAYHHGEASLAGTIIGMAQDFVGSNNINLLLPNGQFGTRHQGGKDHASARYIFTQLSSITRFLFPKDDDDLLNYLEEDGDKIEPTWYVPTIPMVLVNGSEGIGTGWSSYVPNYNPRDIVANIRRLLNGEPTEPMHPWYKGFKGSIEQTAIREGGVTYTVSGIVEEINETTLRITELPVRRWTQDYKEFLESKVKEQLITDYREHNDDTTVHFEVVMSEENLLKAKQEGLMKQFKLTNNISTSNMHLFDSTGVIKKYDTPQQILEDFFPLRLEFYEKRRRVLLEKLELKLLILDNRVRFILGVVKGEIIVNNRKRADLFLELHQKGFTPFPPTKAKKADIAVGDVEENEENEEVIGNKVKASDYGYLLSMSIGTLTLEMVQKLCAEKDEVNNLVDYYRTATPTFLWSKDLDNLDKKLDEQDEEDDHAEVERKALKSQVMAEAGLKGGRQMKNPRKKVTKKATVSPPDTTAASDNSPMETENIVEPAAKAKPRGGAKKAPAKKKKPIEVDSDEDDDEVRDLNERLAAYNLDSSPSVMETEDTRRNNSGKSVSFAATEEVGKNDDSDEDFEVEVVAAPKGGKKGGRKPAANAKASKPAAAAPRKRGPAAKKQPANQKLITDVLKPAEASPDKKVRKMRESPFNKKSGTKLKDQGISSLGKIDSSDEKSDSETEEVVEVVPARPRPQRANRQVKKYVLSDSESEDATEDSEFDADED